MDKCQGDLSKIDNYNIKFPDFMIVILRARKHFLKGNYPKSNHYCDIFEKDLQFSYEFTLMNEVD